ncbi:MAG: NPCBM/NEW2 domain-containing protein [Chthoniobacterales bacterium]
MKKITRSALVFLSVLALLPAASFALNPDPAPVVHDGATVWLDDLDISEVTQGWGTARKNASVDGKPLRIAGRDYARGVGTHAESSVQIQLDGGAYEFAAHVGVDDEVKGRVSSVEFIVIGDSRELWRSGVMKAGDIARDCRVNLAGVKLLELQVSDGGNGIDSDHADWAEARFSAPEGAHLHAVGMPVVAPYLLTPPSPATPRINGPTIFGVRPGSPFLYTVPATGDRPMRFSADGLPDGIKIDGASGRITGRVTKPGAYAVTLRAENSKGNASKRFRIVCGDQIALTPPMGWNSWNCFAQEVSADKVKRAAEVMVRSGLVNHGWSYVNIDDFWQNHRDSGDPTLKGDFRDERGVIIPNQRFPDMKGLVASIHDLGLKVGLYSSPGPWTCGGCAGSHGYERQDAETYAKWGIDYLKYDWCSYGAVDAGQKLDPQKAPSFNLGRGERDREAEIAPYRLMGTLLREQPRDIVYSLCQYGMSDVASWGASVNGNCWRTTHDITDTWASMRGIALAQDNSAAHAGPGNWSDPDMLILGHVGWGNPHPTRLTPDEQYLHMSLWSLFSAPLLIGCDMEKLDDFTLNLLTNDEVIAVNQDALGRQATCVHSIGDIRVYVKELEDGSRAVGFCNFGRLPAVIRYDAFAPLGLKGRQQARDLWRQMDVATVDTARESLPLTIPAHGIVLYKFTSMP